MVNRIVKVDIPQTVLIRRYEVDVESLKELLKSKKKESKLSCKQIAELLDIEKTKVDHWFRTDKYFAIPDREYWYQLKELLHIETDKFDDSIMIFDEEIGKFEKSERHYFDFGIFPTITQSVADEKIIVTYE